MLLILLCGYAIYFINNANDMQLKEDVQREKKLKEEFYFGTKSTTKEYIGNVIGNLVIDSIKLDKMIIKSSIDKLQDNLDLNNIVTTDDFKNKTLFLYGHYTEVYGLNLNRLSEVRLNDTFSIKTIEDNLSYNVVDKGLILKDNIKKLEDDNVVVILTCTKNFDDYKYYYIRGIIK